MRVFWMDGKDRPILEIESIEFVHAAAAAE